MHELERLLYSQEARVLFPSRSGQTKDYKTNFRSFHAKTLGTSAKWEKLSELLVLPDY